MNPHPSVDYNLLNHGQNKPPIPYIAFSKDFVTVTEKKKTKMKISLKNQRFCCEIPDPVVQRPLGLVCGANVERFEVTG